MTYMHLETVNIPKTEKSYQICAMQKSINDIFNLQSGTLTLIHLKIFFEKKEKSM